MADNRKNNKDIPTELVIHYIVKDYRRMRNEWEKMSEEVSRLKMQVMAEKVKGERIGKLKKKMENMQNELEAMKRKCSRKPDGSSVSLHKPCKTGCSVLFHGKGGLCHEHRISYAEMAFLYNEIGDYLREYGREQADKITKANESETSANTL